MKLLVELVCNHCGLEQTVKLPLDNAVGMGIVLGLSSTQQKLLEAIQQSGEPNPDALVDGWQVHAPELSPDAKPRIDFYCSEHHVK